jgi:hypothetical protein
MQVPQGVIRKPKATQTLVALVVLDHRWPRAESHAPQSFNPDVGAAADLL